ncbi:MAG TPA: hypothetical protein VI704_04090 [Bacteroidota bacterium]|nr:hypothetical protein [Bacteroidota bacterium]
MSFARVIRFAAPAVLVLSLPQSAIPQVKPEKLKIAVLYETTFPVIDGMQITRQQLSAALSGRDLEFLSVDELQRKLKAKHFQLLITPYGSAFPKQAAQALYEFLQDGGNWVNIGGVPLAVPVGRQGKSWKPEVRQTAYHKKLGVTQAFPVSVRSIAGYAANSEVDGSEALLGEFLTEETFALYVRFT